MNQELDDDGSTLWHMEYLEDQIQDLIKENARMKQDLVNERERIAQAIEAAWGPTRPTLAVTAYEYGHQDGHREGLTYAARIARRGGRDE